MLAFWAQLGPGGPSPLAVAREDKAPIAPEKPAQPSPQSPGHPATPAKHDDAAGNLLERLRKMADVDVDARIESLRKDKADWAEKTDRAEADLKGLRAQASKCIDDFRAARKAMEMKIREAEAASLVASDASPAESPAEKERVKLWKDSKEKLGQLDKDISAKLQEWAGYQEKVMAARYEFDLASLVKGQNAFRKTLAEAARP